MEFFNSNFFNTNWSDIFNDGYFTNGWLNLSNNFTTWLAAQGGGFHFDSSDYEGWPLPPTPTNTVNTNYGEYTNFWLLVTNNSTNAYVSCVNTLSNLTYEVLTNRNLASTNWGIWRTFLASNSIMPMPSISLSSNAMFFQGRLVWSTGTNGLPDWWQMLYFDQLGVDPNGNPAGDGINNLNKYLIGLNPNIAYVSPLIVRPPGGDYVSMPAISVISLAGSAIKYTTNGSIPSSTNGMSISSGVPLTNLPNGSFTLKAWESGSTSNVPVSAIYTIVPATPAFSIPSGLYAIGTTVQISCTTTNATVYYTTNGVDPTTNSAQILATNIITHTTNQTIKAMGWLGTNASPVVSAVYIVAGPPPNDNFSNATILSGVSGTFYGTTLASTIEPFEETDLNRYFYDAASSGDSVWYKWVAAHKRQTSFLIFPSAGTSTTSFLTSVYFPSNDGPNLTNLVPADFYWNGQDSFTLVATQSIAYYISLSDYHSLGPFDIAWQYVGDEADPPIFSPGSGTNVSAELVTVSDNDTNAVLRYTLDGTNPTHQTPLPSCRAAH